MAGHAGWYAGLIDIGSVANAKAGASQQQEPTVFQWANAKAAPTVATANITGLAAITGGPYRTKAAAKAAAGTGSPGIPGTGPGGPGTSTSTVDSSNGHLPHLPDPLTAIGGFIAALETASTWERVAKVVLGAALILVGMAKLTGATGALKSVAGKVPVIV